MTLFDMEFGYGNFGIEFELPEVSYSQDDAGQDFLLTHILHTLRLTQYDVPLDVVPLKPLDVQGAIFDGSLLSFAYEIDDTLVFSSKFYHGFLGNNHGASDDILFHEYGKNLVLWRESLRGVVHDILLQFDVVSPELSHSSKPFLSFNKLHQSYYKAFLRTILEELN